MVDDTSQYGHLYCFANESMPNLLKVGMTMRDPLKRLKEANSSNTWKPPTPYEILYAKKVKNPRKKEKFVHEFFGRERVNPKREFFRVSHTQVYSVFNKLEGKWWCHDCRRVGLEYIDYITDYLWSFPPRVFRLLVQSNAIHDFPRRAVVRNFRRVRRILKEQGYWTIPMKSLGQKYIARHCGETL
jgi:hypothetical protein